MEANKDSHIPSSSHALGQPETGTHFYHFMIPIPFLAAAVAHVSAPDADATDIAASAISFLIKFLFIYILLHCYVNSQHHVNHK